jgi:hypothetical protein
MMPSRRHIDVRNSGAVSFYCSLDADKPPRRAQHALRDVSLAQTAGGEDLFRLALRTRRRWTDGVTVSSRPDAQLGADLLDDLPRIPESATQIDHDAIVSAQSSVESGDAENSHL